MLPMFVGGSGHILLGLLASAAAMGERRVLIFRRKPWILSGGALGLVALTAVSGSDPGRAVLNWVCAIPGVR